MITKNIYLLEPYKDVIKVNVLSDSIFKLHLNGGVFYSKQEIIDRVNSMDPYSEFEDRLTKIARFGSINTANIYNLHWNFKKSANILEYLNSYSDDVCSGISIALYNLFILFYPEEYCKRISGGSTGESGHAWNGFTDGFYDNINKVPNYKGRYVGASLAEILADKYLYIEPIRNLTNEHCTIGFYKNLILGQNIAGTTDDGVATDNELKYTTLIDNLKMQMPAGSSFIMPVKTTNVPKVEDGFNLVEYSQMVCTFPVGVVGLVEMPVTLLQTTGTGTAKVNGITYTLPADETALKAILQTTPGGALDEPIWYNKFEILTNTGGIECEFLVNRKNWLLFQNNEIQYEMEYGSISFDRVRTLTPIDTVVLSVDKKDSGGWTPNYNKYFTSNKSFLYPKSSTSWDQRIFAFTANAQMKKSPVAYFEAYTKDAKYAINAETAVIDRCFSAKLYPRIDTFSTSVELSFINVDESSVYYTIDGTTPDATKTLYAAPFTILATTTVKWINIKADYANSHVNTRVITKTA